MTRNLCAVVVPEAFSSNASDFLDQEFGGQSVLTLTLQAVVEAGVDQIICVGSSPNFMAATKELNVDFPVTMVQLGSHRVESHLEAIITYLDTSKEDTDLLILAGNQPLLQATDINEIVSEHSAQNAAVTVAVGGPANVDSGTALVADAKGRVQEVAPFRSALAFASEDSELIEAYPLYMFAADLFGPTVRRAKPMATNARVEDLIEVVAQTGNKCHIVDMEHRRTQVQGISTAEELGELSTHLQQDKMANLAKAGVQIVNPALTHIDLSVTVGAGTRIEPFTTITGSTVIGENCQVGPFAEVVSTKLENGSTLSHCSIKYGKMADDSTQTDFGS